MQAAFNEAGADRQITQLPSEKYINILSNIPSSARTLLNLCNNKTHLNNNNIMFSSYDKLLLLIYRIDLYIKLMLLKEEYVSE